MKEIFMTFTRFCDNFEFRDHVPSKSPSAIVCRLSSTVYRLCVLVHAVSEKGNLWKSCGINAFVCLHTTREATEN